SGSEAERVQALVDTLRVELRGLPATDRAATLAALRALNPDVDLPGPRAPRGPSARELDLEAEVERLRAALAEPIAAPTTPPPPPTPARPRAGPRARRRARGRGREGRRGGAARPGGRRGGPGAARPGSYFSPTPPAPFSGAQPPMPTARWPGASAGSSVTSCA